MTRRRGSEQSHGEEDTLRDDNENDYTRKRAIEDGQLIDLTEWASTLETERIPIAITDTGWTRLRLVEDDRRLQGRVHAVLRSARAAVREQLRTLGRVPFSVRSGRKRVPLVITFHESDDDGALVATIMVDGGTSS